MPIYVKKKKVKDGSELQGRRENIKLEEEYVRPYVSLGMVIGNLFCIVSIQGLELPKACFS